MSSSHAAPSCAGRSSSSRPPARTSSSSSRFAISKVASPRWSRRCATPRTGAWRIAVDSRCAALACVETGHCDDGLRLARSVVGPDAPELRREHLLARVHVPVRGSRRGDRRSRPCGFALGTARALRRSLRGLRGRRCAMGQRPHLARPARGRAGRLRRAPASTSARRPGSPTGSGRPTGVRRPGSTSPRRSCGRDLRPTPVPRPGIWPGAPSKSPRAAATNACSAKLRGPGSWSDLPVNSRFTPGA